MMLVASFFINDRAVLFCFLMETENPVESLTPQDIEYLVAWLCRRNNEVIMLPADPVDDGGGCSQIQ